MLCILPHCCQSKSRCWQTHMRCCVFYLLLPNEITLLIHPYRLYPPFLGLPCCALLRGKGPFSRCTREQVNEGDVYFTALLPNQITLLARPHEVLCIVLLLPNRITLLVHPYRLYPPFLGLPCCALLCARGWLCVCCANGQANKQAQNTGSKSVCVFVLMVVTGLLV